MPNATANPALTEPFTPEASDPLAAAAAGTLCISYGPTPPPHSSGGGGAMSLPIEFELHTDSYIAAGPDQAAPAVVGVLQLLGATARDDSFVAEDEAQGHAFAALCAMVLEIARAARTA